MKRLKAILRLFFLIVLTAAAAYAQQTFTHTVTAKTISCNTACSVLDIPELNNDPGAVIFVTPIVTNGFNINPHPIGAYYVYLKKSSIFNLTGRPISDGAPFKDDTSTH